MSTGQAPDVPAGADSKFVEFTAFDRKVSVAKGDEQKQPSLYSLVRSWVLNGRSGTAECKDDTATPAVLPPSQPLQQEPVEYPPECFSKFYVGENPSGELKNLANVYKSAWVTAHTHYSHHKLKRRRRHAQRHNALLAVAQKTQKARHTSGAPPSTLSGPSVPPPSAVPASPPSPTMKPASIAPPLTNSSQAHNNAPSTSKQQLMGPTCRHVPASWHSGPQANTPQPLSSRSKAQGQCAPQQHPPSKGVFGAVFNAQDMQGVEGLKSAHNLVDHSVPVSQGAAHDSMHEAPSSSSHVASGPVNLADMHLRAAQQSHHQHPHHQLAVSVAMDGPGVHASQNSTSAGAPAYGMHTMHAQGGGNMNVGVGGVCSYGAGVSSWEGRHSEQETEHLQRQLQQLAEKESPVPCSIQPPMPIDTDAQHALHPFSRRVTAGGNSLDTMHITPGESGGKPPPAMSAGHGQPLVVPGGEKQNSAKAEQRDRVAGAMGGNRRHVRGESPSGFQHGEMQMDCKPSRTMLDMKDAFALDEVMDISPVQ